MKQIILILALGGGGLHNAAQAQNDGYPGGWRQTAAAPCPNYRRTHWEVSHDAQGRRIIRTWVQTSAGTTYSESYQ